MRLAPLLVLLACGPPAVDGPDDFIAGIYTGTFTLELNASFGPWESATEQCTDDLLLVVEREHDVAPIRGRVYCETPSLGGHLLNIKGNFDTFPDLSGELNSTERTDLWQGRFLTEDRFYVELTGSVEQNGVKVEYTGNFLVCLDPEAERPGTTTDDEAPDDEPFPWR